MEVHVKVLGILNIAWGACGLLAALVVLTLVGGTAGLVVAVEESEEALMAVPILVFIAVAISLLITVLSAPSIVIGVGLFMFQPWARVLGIVLSILHLFSFPVGTLLGTYGLWVLLSNPTPLLFQPSPPRRVSI